MIGRSVPPTRPPDLGFPLTGVEQICQSPRHVECAGFRST
ncbi:hypothetical protein SNL152K_4849 [Streptomyces sp. NL15-2K]|nr:hypothetical protein SNL152K_4849 [Streptomyces sp. NL15-2K]